MQRRRWSQHHPDKFGAESNGDQVDRHQKIVGEQGEQRPSGVERSHRALAVDRIHAMLRRIFLAPISFVAAVMWAIWAQAAEPITVLAPFNLTGPQAALGAPCYKGAE